MRYKVRHPLSSLHKNFRRIIEPIDYKFYTMFDVKFDSCLLYQNRLLIIWNGQKQQTKNQKIMKWF
jgi:hypothetical protein